MISIYDNLVATIIGMVLMLMLVTYATRNVQANVESARYYMARTQGTVLVETIKRDFSNIGAGVDARPDMIERLSPAGQYPYVFAFYGDIDETSPGVERVRYTVTPVEDGCAAMGQQDGAPGGSMTCYVLTREEYRNGRFVGAGGSPASLLDFEVTLFDDAGNELPESDVDVAREIGVAFVMVSPMGQERQVQKMRWESRFRPLNLGR